MTNHPGDYISAIHLSHLRVEELDRRRQHHHIVKQVRRRSVLRGPLAGVLRVLADRLEAPTHSTEAARV